MVLFTKEVFLHLKTLTSLFVNMNPDPASLMNSTPPTSTPAKETWQVTIQGMSMNAPGHMDVMTIINCASRDEAMRLYKELAQQVVDSGTVSELNEKLVDDVLKEK